MGKDFGLPGFFKGVWSFSRLVTIGSSGVTYAKANGNAIFEPEINNDQCLIYTERGLMELNEDTSLRFSRSYCYHFYKGGVSIYFNDGPNPGSKYQSYRINPGELRLDMEEIHLCGADCYQGTYSCRSNDVFELKTIVKGAAKDFVIETSFSRIDIDRKSRVHSKEASQPSVAAE